MCWLAVGNICQDGKCLNNSYKRMSDFQEIKFSLFDLIINGATEYVYRNSPLLRESNLKEIADTVFYSDSELRGIIVYYQNDLLFFSKDELFVGVKINLLHESSTFISDFLKIKSMTFTQFQTKLMAFGIFFVKFFEVKDDKEYDSGYLVDFEKSSKNIMHLITIYVNNTTDLMSVIAVEYPEIAGAQKW